MAVLIKATRAGPPAFRRKARATLTTGSRACPWPEGQSPWRAGTGRWLCTPEGRALHLSLLGLSPAPLATSTGSSAEQPSNNGSGGPSEHPSRIPIRQTPAGLWELKGSQWGPAMASVLAWRWWQAGSLCASQKDASQICSAHCPCAPRLPNPGAQGKELAEGRRFSQLQQADREGGGQDGGVGGPETNNKNKIPVSMLEFV